MRNRIAAGATALLMLGGLLAASVSVVGADQARRDTNWPCEGCVIAHR